MRGTGREIVGSAKSARSVPHICSCIKGIWARANHPLMSTHRLQALSPITVDGGDVMDLHFPHSSTVQTHSPV